MLLVQHYLRTKTFGDLERDHGVEISIDRRFGHKFSLNYSQIFSKENDPLACQCRGLILTNGSSLFESAERRADGNYDFSKICPGSTQILSYGMDRFFNYQQSVAYIDFNDPKLKIFEKIDGSIIFLYFDHIIHQWCCATRSVPEADVPLTGFSDLTFRKLFEKALFNTAGLSFKEFCQKLNPENTYCFELSSPYNRVVVNYNETKIVLIAIRNIKTKLEQYPENEINFPIPVVESYDFGSLNKIIEYVNNTNPLEHEGVVLRDSKFNRIKIKSASYVAFNKATDTLTKSPRACLELVLNEKVDDVVSFVPEEIKKDLFNIQTLLKSFLTQYQENYQKCYQLFQELKNTDPSVATWDDRKIFAKCVEEILSKWTAPAYWMRSNEPKNILDYIKSKQKNGIWSDSFLNNLLELIGFKI